jgi:hypothetical protein
MAAAALLAVLALGAGCGTDSKPSAGTPSGAAAGGNTQQVCTESRKVITDSSAAFSQQMGKIAVAAATGGTAGEKAALADLKKLIKDWSAGLKAQAEKAADPELKQALAELSSGFAAAGERFKSFKDTVKATDYMDSPQIQAASKKLEQFCG